MLNMQAQGKRRWGNTRDGWTTPGMTLKSRPYKMTNDMVQNQSVWPHEDKRRPITTLRRPIGEQVRRSKVPESYREKPELSGASTKGILISILFIFKSSNLWMKMFYVDKREKCQKVLRLGPDILHIARKLKGKVLNASMAQACLLVWRQNKSCI